MMTMTMMMRGLVGTGLVAALLVGQPPDTGATGSPQARHWRIVSLVPAVTEMLFAIGAGPDVVGVSSFDRFPPEVASRPKVGALIDPDFERILTLKPNLVVVFSSQQDLIARLARASIPVFDDRHEDLTGVATTIRALGRRLGRDAAAERVAAAIERDLAAVRTRSNGRPRPMTALIFGREAGALRGMYASGGTGFLHDLLVTAGGRNVFADVARQGLQVSTETILTRAPEVVLEIRSSEGWSADRLAREVGLWSRLPSLPAVRNTRVYILADEKLVIPGPRVVEAARAFFDVLHGGAK
jgi:iron complex transport system substrate-binding protein